MPDGGRSKGDSSLSPCPCGDERPCSPERSRCAWRWLGAWGSECASRSPGPQVYQLAEGPGLWHIVSADKCYSALPPCGKVMSKYRKAFLIWLAIVTEICGTMVVLHYTCESCRAYEAG
jgi:hypothetical protein